MDISRRIFDLKQTTRGRVLQLRLLEKSQYWSAEEMERYQLEMLRNLLTESAANVPYYRRLFKSLDFDPKTDLRKLSDFSQLPLMTKPHARTLGTDLRNERKNIPHIIERTSGSTGEPFVEHIAYTQMAMEKAAVWRHWKWSGYQFRDNVATVRSYIPTDGQPLIKDDPLRNFRFYSAYHMDDENTEMYVRDMLKWSPHYLRGYPSSLEILADTAERMGAKFPRLKGFFTASETLTDAQRVKLEKVFDARVFDWYGLAEQVVSANECGAHQGMHLNSEYGLWELEKRPYLNDNERMIVGTNLRNHCMPLVRYETGDIAVVHENGKTTCSCGRTLPLIKQIRGRKDDLLTAIGGIAVPSVNFYSLFREYDSVKRFQLIQHETERVELRYVADELSAADSESLKKELHERLGAGMKIELKRTGEFLMNSVGKRRPVLSLIGLSESSQTQSTEDSTTSITKIDTGVTNER